MTRCNRMYATTLSLVARASRGFRRARDLTPQERANLRSSRIPPAVIMASLGGHITR
jgi:hypothetical protein